MAFIVEVFRAYSEKPNSVDFSIHYKIWDQLLEEAKKEGWKPSGTIKPDYSDNPIFKNDYIPDYPDSKIISAEDALHLADALSIVLKRMKGQKVKRVSVKGPAIIRDDITAGTPTLSTPDFDIAFLESFIPYLKLGAFDFWWDD
jgi:hypothetical protein